jgi:hypothetical protein
MAPAACTASTAPQMASQKGKWPWVAYITTDVMKKAVKWPPTARSTRRRAASRGSLRVGTSRR